MSIETFKALGLSDVVVEALEKKGFEKPSPIQEQTIPFILNDHRDLIGQAQTGTGKTAAFGLPIIETLEPTDGPIQALVLTPTRELTIQVANEINELKGRKNLKVTPVYGGQSISLQVKQLRQKNDIVVGTPGRLIDHLRSKKVDFSEVKYVVLDEADEMLTTGFLEDIEFILSKTNPDRRTILFSATMPREIMRLAKNYMKDYEMVEAKKETLATTLTEQLYVEVREADKLEAVCRVMDLADEFYGLIFCRTKRDVDAVNERLMHRGYESEAMHGDLSQAQRERVLKKFRARKCQILVVTDVASRGLDISGLSHVINYAIPQDPESYVHRVGRTGRAGKSGTAISLVTPAEHRKLQRIQKIAKTDINKMPVPDVDTIIESKKARLKAQLTEKIEAGLGDDLPAFAQDLLENQSPEDVVAGLLQIAYAKEFSKESYTNLNAGGKGRRDRDRSERGDRYERGGRGRDRERGGERGGRGRDRERGGERDRDRGRGRERDRERGSSRGGDDAGLTRLFVAKGKTDQMNPRRLVEMIEEKSKVRGRHIKNVDIYDSFSFINVPEGDAGRILQAFGSNGREGRPMVTMAKD